MIEKETKEYKNIQELLNEKYESYVKFKNYLMQQIFAQKLRKICAYIQTFVGVNLF